MAMTGADLRAWRERARLTQAELAERLGVKAHAIYKWESEQTRIGHPVILERALRDVARELVDDLAGLRVGKQESRNG